MLAYYCVFFEGTHATRRQFLFVTLDFDLFIILLSVAMTIKPIESKKPDN